MPYIIGKEEADAAREILETGCLDRYINSENGASVQFERSFSRKMGSKYALVVSSGTGALICALKGLGVGPGDEVIIPAFTYIATALAVFAVRAVPIIAEIDSSLTISPIDIAKKVTSKTKAIIPVHMHGLPCSMNKIMDLAKQHNLLVLEDVAQACGGSYQGKKLGSIGDSGAFSFNHYKIITCGEGGALITKNQNVYQRALLQHHGGCIFEPSLSDFDIDFFAGWNFRISEILSAILQVQLSRLDNILNRLRQEKKEFITKLSNKLDKFNFAPIHDEEGDCGRVLFLTFYSSKDAQIFIKHAQQNKIKVWSADTKGHVYVDWQPIFSSNKRISKQEGSSSIQNISSLTSDVCPITISLLRRTVGISMRVDRSKIELDKLIENIIRILERPNNETFTF